MNENQKPKGNQPQFKGDGVAVWVNETREKEKYLSIQLLGKGGIKLNAFLNKPRVEQECKAQDPAPHETLQL